MKNRDIVVFVHGSNRKVVYELVSAFMDVAKTIDGIDVVRFVPSSDDVTHDESFFRELRPDIVGNDGIRVCGLRGSIEEREADVFATDRVASAQQKPKTRKASK